MPVWDNILAMAQTILPTENIIYKKWLRNETNALGYVVPVYADPVETEANIGAQITPEMYQNYKLDLNKDYRLINVSKEIVGNAEQMTPDIVEFYGEKWHVIRCHNWTQYSGFVKILVVKDKDYDGDIETPDDGE